MPQKIPSTGDMAAEPSTSQPAHSRDPGTRLGQAFAQWGSYIEDKIESALDMVLGPSTQESVRAVQQVPAMSKKKRRRQKRLEREKQRRQEAEEIRQKMYESTVKAQMLADAMRAEEKRKEEFTVQLQKSEETNRTLIMQFTLVQVAGLYAVSQACLLAIFVPQKCPAITVNTTSPWFKYNTLAPDGHLCTMKENLDWYNDSTFNQTVIAVNILTLALMLSAQSYFWKREVWFVEHLEEDNSIPYDSLPKEIKGYEEFEVQVRSYNVGAFAFASSLAGMIVLNLSLSTYFLVNGDGDYNYNIGSRTYTGLITNTMLVSTKIVGFWSYARLSYEKNWAISMFTVIPLSYNRVDHEYAGVHWKTEEEMMAEIETKPVEPMPPGWGKQPEAHAEDDMA